MGDGAVGNRHAKWPTKHRIGWCWQRKVFRSSLKEVLTQCWKLGFAPSWGMMHSQRVPVIVMTRGGGTRSGTCALYWRAHCSHRGGLPY
jgi:fatty acid desaturase